MPNHPTPATHHSIVLAGRSIDYRVVSSRAARRLSLRVGPAGVEVIQPVRRRSIDLTPFLVEHTPWLVRQLDRVARLQAAHPPIHRNPDEILLRGTPTRVPATQVRTLERWLKQQARHDIERELSHITPQLGVTPRRLFLRSQRTMWGSCSSRGNLSFNWRCIMAPPEVLRYLVAHEAVHLLIPNHSRRFWQTVHRFNPDADHAKRWLTANGHHLMIDLSSIAAAAIDATAAPAAGDVPAQPYAQMIGYSLSNSLSPFSRSAVTRTTPMPFSGSDA